MLLHCVARCMPALHEARQLEHMLPKRFCRHNALPASDKSLVDGSRAGAQNWLALRLSVVVPVDAYRGAAPLLTRKLPQAGPAAANETD